MGGHAFFGQPVHFLGADLNLDALAARTDHRGVQALVHVGLGHGDVIFKTPGDRFPDGVHEAKHGITFADGFDDNAEGYQIVDLIDGQALDAHLVVDAP